MEMGKDRIIWTIVKTRQSQGKQIFCTENYKALALDDIQEVFPSSYEMLPSQQNRVLRVKEAIWSRCLFITHTDRTVASKKLRYFIWILIILQG